MSQNDPDNVTRTLTLKRPVAPRSEANSPAFARDFSTFGTGIRHHRKGRAEAGKAPENRPRRAPETARRARIDPPAEWNAPRVFDRLVEAVETLGRLPMTVRPRGYANAMPEATQEMQLSLLDMIKMEETGELERLYLAQNRVKLRVTSRQISRMDEALNWPLLYLADLPEVAKAVGLSALWTVQKLDEFDIRRRCHARGMSTKTFYRRQLHGLQIIAQELSRAQIPVS